MRTAEVGKVAIDGEVCDLSGRKQSLLTDFIHQTPKGMPLILNIGRYASLYLNMKLYFMHISTPVV